MYLPCPTALMLRRLSFLLAVAVAAGRSRASKPSSPSLELCQDLLEIRWFAVVEAGARGERLGVSLARGLVRQHECLVLRDVQIVVAAKALLLMRHILRGSDEILHLLAPQQAIDIVVVAHEGEGRLAAVLL